MRINAHYIFAIGNIVGQPMLVQKAVHEAHMAAEVIAGELKGLKSMKCLTTIGLPASGHSPVPATSP